jgi:hypothetical protein
MNKYEINGKLLYTVVRKWLFVMIVAVIPYFILYSCRANEGPVEEQVIEKAVNRIKIYIDNSASNQGYLKGATGFKSTIGDIVRIAETSISDSAETSVFFIADSIRKFDGGGYDFIQYMSTGRVAGGEGYPLDKMFREIERNFESGDVVFFVSDCILSHSDQEIRSNKEINKEAAASTLKQGIAFVFQDFKKKGLSSSVYAFQSEFNGDYFNYRNEGRGSNVSEVRPYYLWVIAEAENMGEINYQLSGNSSFKPKGELHFGAAVETVSQFVTYPGLLAKGQWMTSKDGIYDVKSSKADPGIEFAVGLDLSKLPAYAKEMAYLNKHLVVSSSEFDVDYSFIEKEAEYEQQLKGKFIAQYRANSHLLTIKLGNPTLKEGSIDLQLPLRYDDWYQEWSTDSDLTKSEREGKTFALNHLIEGVISAYTPKYQNFIKLTIKITQ